jgi:cell division protein FtsB
MERETQKEQVLIKFVEAYDKKNNLLSKENKELKAQIEDMNKHIEKLRIESEIWYVKAELIKLEFKQYKLNNK